MGEKIYSDLPDDIWRKIFKNLKELDLSQVSLVCIQFLTITNSLISFLKITNEIHPILPRVLRRFQYLESVVICTKSIPSIYLESKLIRSFVEVLRHIYFSRLSHEARKRLRKLGFQKPFFFSSEKEFVMISDYFPMLEEIFFDYVGCPKLISYPDGFQKMASNLKKLKKISFKGAGSFLSEESVFTFALNSKDLEEVCIESITEDAIGFVMRNSHKLTSLTLDSIMMSPPDSPFSIKNSIAYAKNLHTLSFGQMNISNELVSSLVIAKPPLKKLRIFWSNDIEIHTLSMLFQEFCLIEDLELTSMKDILNSSIDRILPYLTKLTRIDLSCCHRLTNHCFFVITNNCPLLEEIKMGGVSLGVGDVSSMKLRKHDRIRRLSLGWNYSLTDETLSVILRVCPNIQFLFIKFCSITGKSIREVLKSCPFLTHLEICTNLQVSKNFGESFEGETVGLKVLRANSYKMADEDMCEIGRICCNLELLDIEHCEEVTKVGIMEVLRNCKKLEEIHLTRRRHFSIDDFYIMSRTRPSLRKIIVDNRFVPSETHVRNLVINFRCKIIGRV